MDKLKLIIKRLFYISGTATFLDRILYALAVAKNNRINNNYQQNNKEVAIPPDYFLYETYRLNYKEYIEDGLLSAQEIIEWTSSYVEDDFKTVLEWGCGVGRIARHMHTFLNEDAVVHACDINKIMIEWDKENIKDVIFKLINYRPPSEYASDMFDMIYAISVLTHIEAMQQKNWLIEMYRLLQPGGIFLFTTHGSNYFHQLLPSERKQLEEKGTFTKPYYKKGHRMMSTYNMPEQLALFMKDYFEVMEFCDGKENKERTGGQDLWIIRKRLK